MRPSFPAPPTMRHRARRPSSAADHRRFDSRGGFSLVEVLIASVLLLVVAVGIVPLFVRSIGLNQEGRFATVSTAIASSEIERLLDSPFDGVDMTIAAGTENLREEFQAVPRGEWIDVNTWPDGTPFVFHRIIRVRQFNLNALDDGVLEESEALPSGTAPGLIQLKEIVIQVESGNFNAGVRRQVTLRAVRGV